MELKYVKTGVVTKGLANDMGWMPNPYGEVSNPELPYLDEGGYEVLVQKFVADVELLEKLGEQIKLRRPDLLWDTGSPMTILADMRFNILYFQSGGFIEFYTNKEMYEFVSKLEEGNVEGGISDLPEDSLLNI